MAFVEKKGSRYQVRQGNKNDLLSTFGSKKKADEEVARLHKKNILATLYGLRLMFIQTVISSPLRIMEEMIEPFGYGIIGFGSEVTQKQIHFLY